MLTHDWLTGELTADPDSTCELPCLARRTSLTSLTSQAAPAAPAATAATAAPAQWQHTLSASPTQASSTSTMDSSCSHAANVNPRPVTIHEAATMLH